MTIVWQLPAVARRKKQKIHAASVSETVGMFGLHMGHPVGVE